MFVLKSFVIAYSLFTFSDAKFVDTLKKCSIKDNACLKSLYQNIVMDARKHGIPEVDLPPLDPLVVKNITVTLLDQITATLVDGVVKGIGNCVLNSFNLDLDKQIVSLDITCDVSIKGTVTLVGQNPAIQAVLGDPSVDAVGHGKIKLDKLHLKVDAPFNFFKNDGEIYLTVDEEAVKYIYDIQNLKFSADKIYIGKTDISQLVISYLNQNWRTLVKNFGQIFMDKAMNMLFTFSNKFFKAVPVSKYIIEDMSSYVEN